MSSTEQRTLAKFPEAIAEFEAVCKQTGDTPYALGELGNAYARAGRTNEARQTLEKLNRLSAGGGWASAQIALVYQGLGDLDQSFSWLQKAAESRDMDPRVLRDDPLWREVTKDPRYAA